MARGERRGDVGGLIIVELHAVGMDQCNPRHSEQQADQNNFE